MTPPTSKEELDPFKIARRILELQADVDRNVRARQYEAAARMRDEHEALERQLGLCGNLTLIRNIAAAKSPSIAPLIQSLEPEDLSVDKLLIQKLSGLGLPVRWVICNTGSAPVGSLRRLLEVESVASVYFMAKFPVISSTSLSKATYLDQWINALARETATSKTAVVWICTDIDWLGANGILEKWWRLFQHESFEFIACVSSLDGPWEQRMVSLPGAKIIQS